jgi:hypothetical protein
MYGQTEPNGLATEVYTLDSWFEISILAVIYANKQVSETD